VNQRPFQIAIIGCGLIGKRRASSAERHESSRVSLLIDVAPAAAERLAIEYGGRFSADWRDAINDPKIDVVVAATPNGHLAEIAIAALNAGKHVLVEKPMGRNLAEATKMAEAAGRSGRVLKIGFNHRYHPAIARAHEKLHAGDIGELINLRARYGHGGRPGYEREWRGNPELAGGGELTDQGVHIADLIHWFAGLPAEAFAYTQTAVWPIAPLEDNAFGLFRFAGGAVASFHTSWTQWKNMFSFEIFGTEGSLIVDGLGKSYGVERLISMKRSPGGGAPAILEKQFEGDDLSWYLEWDEFMGAIQYGRPYSGGSRDGVAAMAMLDALYSSAKLKRIVTLNCPFDIEGLNKSSGKKMQSENI